jgi:tRNA dimethylallyltransferase
VTISITQRERIAPPAQKRQRVIVVAGPTATGKSDLAFSLAQILGGEILSADSVQIYRNMDIGTAKVSAEKRAAVTHHLIDVCEPNQTCNVVEFCALEREAMLEISLRDSVPIVVGGSGFYLRAILYGPPQGPSSHPEVRRMLEKQMEELGPEVLYERLQILDPIYAETITEKDRHKVIRALEIMALSDCKVSDFGRSEHEEPDDAYDFRCWFLYYPKETLYRRIEERCDEMIANGLLDEVRRLKELCIEQNPSAAQAIGYKQILAFLKGSQTPQEWQRCIADFKRASRHYAKRQFTWFRKEPLFRWVNLEEFGVERVKELILQDFEQGI